MKCFICGKQGYTEVHHIFGGANRKKSEQMNLVVNLCMSCHRTGKHAVHNDAEVMLKLHQYGEAKYMMLYDKSREDFREEFGKNYILED